MTRVPGAAQSTSQEGRGTTDQGLQGDLEPQLTPQPLGNQLWASGVAAQGPDRLQAGGPVVRPICTKGLPDLCRERGCDEETAHATVPSPEALLQESGGPPALLGTMYVTEHQAPELCTVPGQESRHPRAGTAGPGRKRQSSALPWGPPGRYPLPTPSSRHFLCLLPWHGSPPAASSPALILCFSPARTLPLQTNQLQHGSLLPSALCRTFSAGPEAGWRGSKSFCSRPPHSAPISGGQL